MRQVFTLLIGMIASLSSIAQSNGSISGKITDQQSKVMQAATVSLLRGKDSSVVKFTVTDKAGNFQFENVAAGQYLVSISAVGHSKAYSPKVDVKENANT